MWATSPSTLTKTTILTMNRRKIPPHLLLGGVGRVRVEVSGCILGTLFVGHCSATFTLSAWPQTVAAHDNPYKTVLLWCYCSRVC